MNMTKKPDPEPNNLRFVSFVTLGVAVIIVLVALTASAVRGGEVEAAVLVEAQEELGTTMSADDVSSDEMFDEIDNLMEIWNDTEAGSHCEQYAASLVSLAFAGYFVTDDPEDTVSYVNLTGLFPLVEQTDTLYNNCLNEE